MRDRSFQSFARDEKIKSVIHKEKFVDFGGNLYVYHETRYPKHILVEREISLSFSQSVLRDDSILRNRRRKRGEQGCERTLRDARAL